MLVLIGGGISMCVLYEPGERIGTVGYCILALMFAAIFVVVSVPIVVYVWWRYLDLNCIGCGRPLYAADLPMLRETGRCPGCGHAISAEELEDY